MVPSCLNPYLPRVGTSGGAPTAEPALLGSTSLVQVEGKYLKILAGQRNTSTSPILFCQMMRWGPGSGLLGYANRWGVTVVRRAHSGCDRPRSHPHQSSGG